MEYEFTHTPISKLVIRLGIPSMFAQFFTILYSIVDRIFIANLPDVGSLCLTAIGICAPAMTVLSAFAMMIGIGGSSYMSIQMGKANRNTAQKTIETSLILILVISVILTVLLLFYQEPLLYLLGSSVQSYPYAASYFVIYVSGTIVSLTMLSMNQFILAQGFAKEGMIAVILGSVSNVILDPICIYALNLGIQGAALATVLSQILSLLYVLYILLRPTTPIRLRFGFDPSLIQKILIIGLMPFLITGLDNGILILMNIQLRRYGGIHGDSLIACAAIVQSFMTIVNVPGGGITAGCSTLFSFQYGAGNYKKVMQCYKDVFYLCLSYIAMLFLLAQFFPESFAQLFSSTPEQLQMSAKFISMYTLALLGIAVQLALVDGTTAMGKVAFAMPMSLFRKGIYILSLLILPAFFNTETIFYSGSLADGIGSLFTIFFFFLLVKPTLQKELDQPKNEKSA